jgi:hypothetical protein
VDDNLYFSPLLPAEVEVTIYAFLLFVDVAPLWVEYITCFSGERGI